MGSLRINKIISLPAYEIAEILRKDYGKYIIYLYKYYIVSEDGVSVYAINKKSAIKACEVYKSKGYHHIEASRFYRIRV